MNYEIVNLEEKTVVGLSARTNNFSPEMENVIGGLWNRFYGEGVYASIEKKCNEKSLGIYTDYAGNEKDDYNIIVACETKKDALVPEGAVKQSIPAGKYAKFVVTGDMHQAVAAFWQELWQMNLSRTYVCDFEEYQNADMEHAVIHIYIGVN